MYERTHIHMHVYVCMYTYMQTYTHTPPRFPQSRYPTIVLPSHSGGLPFLQEANGLRKLPEPYGGEGGEVKSIHIAFFLARSEAVRAKGVEFLVSKGAPAKLLLLVAAPLREMEGPPCPPPPLCKQSHKSRVFLQFCEWGWIKVVWWDLSEGVSFGLRWPPPSQTLACNFSSSRGHTEGITLNIPNSKPSHTAAWEEKSQQRLMGASRLSLNLANERASLILVPRCPRKTLSEK